MRISDWSSDVCSSDLRDPVATLDGDVRRLEEFDTQMPRDRLQALGVSGGGQMIAVIAAAVDLAVGVGEEQPSAERRARGQREIVEPGDEAVMARPDPMREEIDAVDRRAMGAKAVEEGRPGRKSGGSGKRVTVGLEHGGRRIIKKKKK